MSIVVRDNVEYLTLTGLKARGWTEAAIRKLLGNPDKLECNPRYRAAAQMRLYKLSRVLAVEKTAEFKGWRKQHLQRSAQRWSTKARERRYARFGRKYETWRDALLAACGALFNLNRYAKHKSCSDNHKQETYALKHDMVRLLYRQKGFRKGCYLQSREARPRPCSACRGRGGYWPRRACRRCNGSGTYNSGKRLDFVCFEFLVDDQRFSWHLPLGEVGFHFTVTAMNRPWGPDEGPKAISLPASKFAEAKDLLRWVLAQAELEPEPTKEGQENGQVISCVSPRTDNR